MSLNWREIERILEELPLTDALIQDIRQPRHFQLVLELYRRGQSFQVLFSLANPHCRLHRLSRRLSVTGKPQRFVSFLRAHVRGGRIVAASQVGAERIVRLEVRRSAAASALTAASSTASAPTAASAPAQTGAGEPEGATVILWARLWAGAANLIATDAQGRILDALYRRPKRGEISGGLYQPPQDESTAREACPAREAREARAAREFTVRELPGPGDFNERVERHYFALEEQAERERLRAAALGRLRRREVGLLAAVEALERRREQFLDADSLRRSGELILANLHALSRGSSWLQAEDPQQPGARTHVELDPRLSPSENAAAYFRRYRRAREGLSGLEEQLAQQREALSRLRAEIERTRGEPELERLRAAAPREDRRPDSGAPGLEFRSGACRILVGRTAKENEELLRGHTRGNDTWIHARDYAGAYVFVRAPSGKSVPLEALLDGATLALWYSKGRQSGRGDVYYTQVKYLRRPRGGKPGLVLPTQEKNLHVRLEAQRLRRLQEGSDPPAP